MTLSIEQEEYARNKMTALLLLQNKYKGLSGEVQGKEYTNEELIVEVSADKFSLTDLREVFSKWDKRFLEV